MCVRNILLYVAQAERNVDILSNYNMQTVREENAE